MMQKNCTLQIKEDIVKKFVEFYIPKPILPFGVKIDAEDKNPSTIGQTFLVRPISGLANNSLFACKTPNAKFCDA